MTRPGEMRGAASSSPIRRLDPRVVAKIAAGEMISRPFSVVKELVENAIDAGAGAIEVQLGPSPDQWLQVSDDGCGMSPEDLRLALESHATSKLSSEEDLLRVTSLGFRGEALPSIGRVARLEIRTAPENDEGARIVVDGGETRVLEPAARARGTTVTVQDLFFNTPVRKRFLRKPEGEVRLISKLVTTYALAFPGVAFRLLNRGETTAELPPVESLAERISQIHGPAFAEKVLPVERTGGSMEIHGYVGIPELARPGTQHQTLLVNQRWVTAPWFSASLRQGFGDLLSPNRHPWAVILLVLDPSRVDVNVHPTKREVRFLDEGLLFGELVRAVRSQTTTLVPGWNLDPRDPGSASRWTGDGGMRPEILGPERWGQGHGSARRPEVQENLRLLYGDPLSPAARVRDLSRGTPEDRFAHARGGEEDQTAEEAPEETVRDLADPHPQDAGARESADTEDGAESGPGLGATSDAGAALVTLWQLHRKYVFAQTRQGFLIIDQHAAHERIIYEQALAQLQGAPVTAQQLLFPLPIHLEHDERDAWEEFGVDLVRLGVDAEDFGGDTLLLRGVPARWDSDPEGRLRELLHELSHQRGRGDSRDQRLAASFACRTAIRAGRSLSLEEMNSLVDQLFATEVPHGDPHGRPTFLQISLDELDRRFGRSG